MVFDNFGQPDKFQRIADFFPQGETGSIIVTRRHGDSERLGTPIRLTIMTEDEGLELLLRQSRLEETEENVITGKPVIQRLGYLPLAIDQAGAYISVRKLALKLFVKHYEDRREAVLKHTPSLWEYRRRMDEYTDEISLSAFTTWELSFDCFSITSCPISIKLKI